MQNKNYIRANEEMVRGNDHSIVMVFTDEDGVPMDISSWHVLYKAKTNTSQPDGSAEIAYDSNVDTANITFWAEGESTVSNAITIYIEDVDSYGLDVGQLVHEAKRDIAGGQPWAFMRGTLTVLAEVNRGAQPT